MIGSDFNRSSCSNVDLYQSSKGSDQKNTKIAPLASEITDIPMSIDVKLLIKSMNLIHKNWRQAVGNEQTQQQIQAQAKQPNNDLVWQTKVHLAAALRLAVRDQLEEGIDNHFTVMVPGYTDRFMILPFGKHWSEARASDIMIFNEAGEILEGSAKIELSALCIHAPVHRLTGAKVVLHTHQTWALALNMLKDNRLLPASQTASFISNTIAYDDTYTGLAHSMNEGERISAAMGDKKILFMKNHGVMVLGDTVGEAYKKLYRLERVCRAQVLAMINARNIPIPPTRGVCLE